MQAYIHGRNVNLTFRPPNLSGSRHAPFNLLTEVAPRNVDADIDLYVSRDPLLLNLDPLAVAAAAKSTNRGGTELVTFSNGVLNEVFYVGVKAEDYQASEFSLLGIATDQPFCQQVDSNNIIVNFFGLPEVHELADPLAGLVLNVLAPGHEHPWHFDTNEFTVTLLTQRPEEGGEFEYCPGIRSQDAENLDDVRAVLDGRPTRPPRMLTLRPGDLQLFRGRYSLHRVRRVAGSTARAWLVSPLEAGI